MLENHQVSSSFPSWMSVWQWANPRLAQKISWCWYLVPHGIPTDIIQGMLDVFVAQECRVWKLPENPRLGLSILSMSRFPRKKNTQSDSDLTEVTHKKNARCHGKITQTTNRNMNQLSLIDLTRKEVKFLLGTAFSYRCMTHGTTPLCRGRPNSCPFVVHRARGKMQSIILYIYIYISIWQCVKTLYPWWTSK